MNVLMFYQTVGAVFLANVLSFVVAYGVWRATKAEKLHGLQNGANILPIWLLIAMLIGPGISAWAAITLN